MLRPTIPSDSHVSEPPNYYVDYIDARYRERAPRLVHDEKRGDIIVVDGSDRPIPLSLISAAGKTPEELSARGIQGIEVSVIGDEIDFPPVRHRGKPHRRVREESPEFLPRPGVVGGQGVDGV